METFNNTSLFTGYLKQLLHEFNLPCYRIYTRENADFFDKYGKEDDSIIETVIAEQDADKKYNEHIRYVPYIKNGLIQEYVNGQWIKKGTLNTQKRKHIHYYDYNLKILNYTKNLEIKDNVYDSYTHEYLGEYLRFLRDYKNINLMPLYNCFSDRAVDKLKLLPTSNSRYIFDTDDPLYKFYMVPVKLFKEYTIAIDSAMPIEVCCALYDNVLDKREKFKNIPSLTYQKLRNCQFNNPILFTKLNEKAIKDLTKSDSAAELVQSEEKLKLIIKLPKNNDSSIVILEGNYLNWNNEVCSFRYPYLQEPTRITHNDKGEVEGRTKIIYMSREDTTQKKDLIRQTNCAVINRDCLDDSLPFALKTPLQLLRFNSKKQHPYSDKLVQYLLGNVISELDDISSNIKRAQKVMRGNGYKFKYDGLWTDSIREITYDFITKWDSKYNTFENNYDVLGYIDKDIEKLYYYVKNTRNKETNKIIKRESESLLSVELEEDR